MVATKLHCRRIVALALFLAALVDCRSSKAVDADDAKRCNHILNIRTEALKAHDWVQLESFSRAYVIHCKWIGTEALAVAYGGISLSLVNNRKPKEALEMAETCKRTDDNLPNCHVNEGVAFLALGQKENAKTALMRAQTLATSGASRIENDLPKVRGTVFQEQEQARLQMFRQMYDAAEMILKRNGLK